MQRSSLLTTGGPNLLALLVACGAITVLTVNTDPIVSGGNPGGVSAASIEKISLPPAPPLPEAEVTGQSEAGEVTVQVEQTSASPENFGVLTGMRALQLHTQLLQRGCQKFHEIKDYTATFTRQERIQGCLGEEQIIQLKLRHAPFSIYMKWESGDPGRQLIYVQGLNNQNILVQPGGLKGRLTGLLELDPLGSLAMSECRYPVTKAGLVALAEIILSHELKDASRGTGFRCELRDDQTFDDQPCYRFVCEYLSPAVNADYRQTIIYVNKELSLPVCVKNFTWGTDVDPQRLDEETLVEFYAYTDITVNSGVADAEFDPSYPAYRLRVKSR